ncbi:MAG: spore germination protein [Clostridia bacterium]|nr:spore germination protein [Clostridia bacterium]
MAEKQTETPQRSITEPPTGQVLLGPREGFIENIDTNVSLVTKRIKSKDLKWVKLTIGRYTQTQVMLGYIDSIADQTVVKTVLTRLKKINCDGIVDTSYISESLNPDHVGLYNAAASEEKPDVVASRLLEGRIVILVDGSPVALTIPHIFLENVQNSNDYYGGNAGVKLKRTIRLIGALIAILLPGFFLAVSLYHLSIIPLKTLTSIANATENDLFPPIVEMILVIILFEIIYEATLVMPKHLGSATSIIAVFVVGEVASTVGLLSAPTVLVVAISGITSYIMPNMIAQISILRFIFCLVGGFLGLYGLVAGFIVLLVYTASIDHYGAPYLAPFAPYIADDQKDALDKVPFPEMIKRPQSIPNHNPIRQRATEENHEH